MRGLVISGGAIDDAFACETIKNGGYDVLYAADSGMDFLYRHHLTPDIIVGDFDSAGREALSFFRSQEQIEFCELNPEKDETDTEYAVRDAMERGVDSLDILGGFGTRMDHMLANTALLGLGLENHVEMMILDAKNRIRMVCDSCTLSKRHQFGTYVSLLPVTEQAAGVTLKGFKYPLQDAVIRRFSSLGVSNEIAEERAEITVKEGILLVIESKD